MGPRFGVLSRLRISARPPAWGENKWEVCFGFGGRSGALSRVFLRGALPGKPHVKPVGGHCAAMRWWGVRMYTPPVDNGRARVRRRACVGPVCAASKRLALFALAVKKAGEAPYCQGASPYPPLFVLRRHVGPADDDNARTARTAIIFVNIVASTGTAATTVTIRSACAVL